VTDLDRKIAQLRRLLYATHYEDYDFIYLPVTDAITIVRLLEEFRRKEQDHAAEMYKARERMVSGVRFVGGGDDKE
jgi:hypothetical protein